MMKLNPLRPLIVPGVLLVLFIVLALFIPLYHHVDAAIINLVHALPQGHQGLALLVAKLGDPLELVIVAIMVSAWEAHRRQFVRAFVMAGSLSALPIFFLVKETVRRARPVTNYVMQHGLHDFSFPSGHSSGSMAVYGMIFVLAYSHLAGKLRLFVTAMCALIIVAIGLTRVYLGAHFPTDVIGGWLLGLTIISLLRSVSIIVAKRRDKPARQALKDSTEDPEKV